MNTGMPCRFKRNLQGIMELLSNDFCDGETTELLLEHKRNTNAPILAKINNDDS